MYSDIQSLPSLTTTRASEIQIHQVAKRDVIVLCLILLIGGIVRFSFPQVIDWSTDHSNVAMMALDITEGKNIPLVGNISSAGIPNSPFFIYIPAIPYIATDNPIIATMFISVLSLVGVGLLWLIAFRYIHPIVALVAGVAYAVHPWAVGFSRTIWSGDQRAPLLLLGLLIGLYGFVEGKRWGQILSLPLMLIALQIHYAAWTLLPLYFCLVWMGRGNISRNALAISVFLGILTLLPFSIGIVQTLHVTTKMADTIQLQTRSFSFRDLVKPYGQMVWLATGLGSEQYTARQNAADLLAQARVPMFLWVLQGCAVALGVFALWKNYPRKLAVFVSIWAFFPLLVFSLPIIGVFPHYFIPVIPALCILLGIGVKSVLDWLDCRQPIAKAGIWAIFGAIAVTQASFVLASLKYVDTHFTPTQFGFGTPIHYMMNMRDELKRHNDLVFIDSSDWLDFSRTSSWVWAPFVRNTANCLRDVQVGSNIAVFPAEPFVAVFAPRAPSDPVLSQIYGSSQSTVFSLRPDEGVYSLNALSAAHPWPAGSFIPINTIRFANDVQLTGYQLAPDRLSLEWSLPAASTFDYQYVIELLNANGDIIATHDANFWPSKNWCRGDRLISWVVTSVPSEARILRLRMLQTNNKAVVRLRDAAGNLAGSEALTPLTR